MSNNPLRVTLAKPDPDQVDIFHGYVVASTQPAIDAGGEVSSRFGLAHIHGDAPLSLELHPTRHSREGGCGKSPRL